MSSQMGGGLAEVHFPDAWTDSTSWERAKHEDYEINRVGRAEYMVQVGTGELHRCLFALDDGELRGECDCKGWLHGSWCAHVASLLLAYVRHEVQPADVATPVEDEVNALWATRPDGGDDRTRGVPR